MKLTDRQLNLPGRARAWGWEANCPVPSFCLWERSQGPSCGDRSPWELKHESRTLSAHGLVQERLTEGEGMLGTRVLQGTKWP